MDVVAGLVDVGGVEAAPTAMPTPLVAATSPAGSTGVPVADSSIWAFGEATGFR